jgi:putative Mn2+ efflux pump MntP
MDLLTVLFIAVGLAMDAFAVSVTNGAIVRRLGVKQALTMALSFGFFQGAMPIVGWLAGTGFKDIIANVDHWIAFGLLLLVGGKMIYESFLFETPVEEQPSLSAQTLLLLSIATSVDALAVGLSFSLIGVEIILPAVMIGCVTFVLSVVGVWIGKKIGHFFEKKIEAAGGIILIIIGFKILIEHIS